MAPKDDISLQSSLGVFTAAEHIQCIWKLADASTKWLVSLTKVYTQYVPLETVLHSSAKMYNFKPR